MNFLIDAINYLAKRGRHSAKVQQLGEKFVNLAPTDKADEDWIYFSALNRALEDPDVYNIALTGPYGSGKSSVIKSFLKRRRKPALEISLASFLAETDDIDTKVSKQEIERSILQQMLYGSDANKLPLSRFKRIRAPRRWNWAVSLIILLGCMTLWHLFQNREEIVTRDFFRPFDLTNWFNLSVAAFGFAFLWYALHRTYLKSFGVSLKSVSLTDVEITPESAEEESILNRHLDEIIYFFQSTRYDLVIIEDLDRFDNPDIFVTLREINSLVNANFGVKKRVRFLYALRDDIFTNTDRTKFFEFIVPVIPIINHSNSIDKVLEEGQRLSLESKLDQQFLREVSRYLNDLRLIKNIFNEFVTYSENLESEDDDSLDPNKLLAILIYKNVQPNDFEKLHQQQGALAGILSRYEELVSGGERRIRAEILEIENSVVEAERHFPKTLAELRKIYAMGIIGKMNDNHSMVRMGSITIPNSKLADHENFEEALSSKSLQSRSMQGHQAELNLSKLEAEIDPEKTYLERKAQIELLSAELRKKTDLNIRGMRSKMASLRTEKFGNVIRANASQAEDCFSGLGESEELVRFLIFEGFLDDTYYQYISLFHSGRLSPNDNKFLIQIRSFNNPDPDFKLDNKAEVIAMMRDEDFGQPYILNRHLMDEILGDTVAYDAHINKAVQYIAKNFSQCSEFFASYYSNGKHVGELVIALAERWDGFVPVAVHAKAAVEHVANVIDHVALETITGRLNADGIVSSFLGANLSAVLETNGSIDLEKVKLLEIEVEDISALLPDLRVLNFVADNSLYRITIGNIQVVLERQQGGSEVPGLDDRHYTTVLASGKEELCRHIERNFTVYLRNVLLQLEQNTNEGIETIQQILKHGEVPQEHLEEFLYKQDVVFPSLELIPQQFHSALFEKLMVEATWKNLISYINGETFDPAVLAKYMQSPDQKTSLLQETYDKDDWTLPLSRFILNNEFFTDEEYRQYVQKLPVRFKNFPETVSASRRVILIEEGTVRLTEEVFAAAISDKSVVASLLICNVDEFLKDRSKYPIDDVVREVLLTSNISDDKKLLIIEDVDPASVPANAPMAEKIGAVFNRVDIDFKPYGSDFLKAVLLNAKPITAKVSLLNKCRGVLTNDQVRQVLKDLPEPFPDFVEPWKTPKIPNTPYNSLLVTWLEEREIISSSRVTFLGEIKINTFRKPRSE